MEWVVNFTQVLNVTGGLLVLLTHKCLQFSSYFCFLLEIRICFNILSNSLINAIYVWFNDQDYKNNVTVSGIKSFIPSSLLQYLFFLKSFSRLFEVMLENSCAKDSREACFAFAEKKELKEFRKLNILHASRCDLFTFSVARNEQHHEF